jgi:very-long-chain ceramide synthase
MIGNAVYLSMDIPDAMLAVCSILYPYVSYLILNMFQFSKLLNYFQYERSKTVSFAIFVAGWS